MTGTKGKSTTTAALGEMLKAKGGDVRVGGSIGRAADRAPGRRHRRHDVRARGPELPARGHARLPSPARGSRTSPDHLDRHRELADHAAAKARVFANQTAEDFRGRQRRSPRVLALARAGRARRRRRRARFGRRRRGASSGRRLGAARRLGRALFPLEREIARAGISPSDLLLAATAARALLALPGDVAQVRPRRLAGFPTCSSASARKNGASLSDSPGLPTSLRRREAWLAMDRPTHLILGGRYKGGEFRDSRRQSASLVQVLAIGETRDRIAAALGDVVASFAASRCATPSNTPLRPAKPGEPVARAGLLVVRHVPGLCRARATRWKPSRRSVAKKLQSDQGLFAVTAAPGPRLVMVWSASSALAQETHGTPRYFLAPGSVVRARAHRMAVAMRTDYRSCAIRAACTARSSRRRRSWCWFSSCAR